MSTSATWRILSAQFHPSLRYIAWVYLWEDEQGFVRTAGSRRFPEKHEGEEQPNVSDKYDIEF